MRSAGISLPSTLPQGYKKGYLSGYEADKMPDQNPASWDASQSQQSSAMQQSQSQAQSQPKEQPASEVSSAPSVDLEGKQKSSIHSALSSLKSKAKRFSFSSSSSSKDHAALPESKEDFEKMRKREVEEEKRTEYEKFGLGKKGLGKGVVQMGG